MSWIPIPMFPLPLNSVDPWRTPLKLQTQEHFLSLHTTHLSISTLKRSMHTKVLERGPHFHPSEEGYTEHRPAQSLESLSILSYLNLLMFLFAPSCPTFSHLLVSPSLFLFWCSPLPSHGCTNSFSSIWQSSLVLSCSNLHTQTCHGALQAKRLPKQDQPPIDRMLHHEDYKIVLQDYSPDTTWAASGVMLLLLIHYS